MNITNGHVHAADVRINLLPRLLVHCLCGYASYLQHDHALVRAAQKIHRPRGA
jgi:hypothetical protein